MKSSTSNILKALHYLISTLLQNCSQEMLNQSVLASSKVGGAMGHYYGPVFLELVFRFFFPVIGSVGLVRCPERVQRLQLPQDPGA